MHIRQVRARNFRSLADLEADLHPGLNWIWGDNAAGKSTILEALLALGRGRNHRAGPADAVGPLHERWQLEATILDAAGSTPGEFCQVQIRAGRGASQRRLDGRAVNQLSLARQLPIALLEPESHDLVGEGPEERRRFVDWGVFHVEHAYASAYIRWQRLLKQRNAALRRGAQGAEISAWDAEMVAAAERVDEARRRHIGALAPLLSPLLTDLAGAGPWTIDWLPGWPPDEPLAEVLRRTLADDRDRRRTGAGPQRAELRIQRAAHSARSRVSRGEEKLVVAALLLAQRRLIRELRGASAVLLVDDFSSELGDAAQARLFAALRGEPGQSIVTDLRPPAGTGATDRVFHVEHGRLHRVVE